MPGHANGFKQPFLARSGRTPILLPPLPSTNVALTTPLPESINDPPSITRHFVLG